MWYYKESQRKQIARRPERNHGAYKQSGFLRTKISLIWQYGPEKVVQASTKIRVTKAESNIKLIPIEKKFFKLDSTQPIAISLDLLTN